MRYCSVKCQREHRRIHLDDCLVHCSVDSERTGAMSAIMDAEDDAAELAARKGRIKGSRRRNAHATDRGF